MNKNQKKRARMAERNKAVRAFFTNHLEKNPQWRYAAIVELTADKFYLAEKTIEAILAGTPPYDDEDNEKAELL